MTGPRPIPAALAVVLRDGRALLVRRRNRPDAGRWGFPGGKIEPGERVADAAVRELSEETGITATAGETLATLDVIGHEQGGALAYHYVLIAVACHWQAGEPVAADDAEEAAWIPVADLVEGDPGLSADVARIARLAQG